MKKTNLSILLLFILSLTATSLSAQVPCAGFGYGMGFHKPFSHLERLQYSLDLTNAQVDKVYQIEKDYMDKFYMNRKDREKLKDLTGKFRNDFESVLTADQKVKWNDFHQNHPYAEKYKRPGRYPGDRPGTGMGLFNISFLQKDLGLSDDQVDKIYKISRNYMDRFYQDRNDGDKVRELRIKLNSEFDNILSPEQKIKWKDLRSRPPRFRDKPRKNWKQGHPFWSD